MSRAGSAATRSPSTTAPRATGAGSGTWRTDSSSGATCVTARLRAADMCTVRCGGMSRAAGADFVWIAWARTEPLQGWNSGCSALSIAWHGLRRGGGAPTRWRMGLGTVGRWNQAAAASSLSEHRRTAPHAANTKTARAPPRPRQPTPLRLSRRAAHTRWRTAGATARTAARAALFPKGCSLTPAPLMGARGCHVTGPPGRPPGRP